MTIRAVRHYHQRGLLPEPDRDASGYRRYDADSVIELIRIKALADAGVPLARIQQLLVAEPAEFAAAVAEIDTFTSLRLNPGGLEADGADGSVAKTAPSADGCPGGRGTRLARCLALSSNRAARSTASAAASWSGLTRAATSRLSSAMTAMMARA